MARGTRNRGRNGKSRASVCTRRQGLCRRSVARPTAQARICGGTELATWALARLLFPPLRLSLGCHLGGKRCSHGLALEWKDARSRFGVWFDSNAGWKRGDVRAWIVVRHSHVPANSRKIAAAGSVCRVSLQSQFRMALDSRHSAQAKHDHGGGRPRRAIMLAPYWLEEIGLGGSIFPHRDGPCPFPCRK